MSSDSSDNTVVAPAAPVPPEEGPRQRFPILKKRPCRVFLVTLGVLLLLGLLGLIALPHGHPASDRDAGGRQSDIITDDTFFYGQSEPVYPSRKSAP